MKTLHVLRPLCLLCLLCALSPPASADDAVGLRYVTDGDTIEATGADGQSLTVRLYGIDAPEGAQPGADEARAGLIELLEGRRVTLLPMTHDRTRRIVALVFADGSCANAAMVARGHAWVFPDYCKLDFCRDWDRLEAAAREARRGLWAAEERPVPPWRWRLEERIRHPGKRGPGPRGYRGNVNSHVFHHEDCQYFDCLDCVRSFQTREEAIEAGFKPCAVCRP